MPKFFYFFKKCTLEGPLTNLFWGNYGWQSCFVWTGVWWYRIWRLCEANDSFFQSLSSDALQRKSSEWRIFCFTPSYFFSSWSFVTVIFMVEISVHQDHAFLSGNCNGLQSIFKLLETLDVATMPAISFNYNSRFFLHATMLIVLLLLPFSVSVCSWILILLCHVYFDNAEIKDTTTFICLCIVIVKEK